MALPPSSPRLPSPPPPTEIQIGPKSPSLSSTSEGPMIEQSTIDATASRRIHPGTKSADMAAGPPLIPLGEVNPATSRIAYNTDILTATARFRLPTPRTPQSPSLPLHETSRQQPHHPHNPRDSQYNRQPARRPGQSVMAV